MKNIIYIILVALMLSCIVPVIAVSDQEQYSRDVPDGYVKLSDTGIDIPGAEDRIIPEELADNLTKDFIGLENYKQITDRQKNLLATSPKINTKSAISVKIPEAITASGASILSSATTSFTGNITKLWNKTYATGDYIDASPIPDLSGDNLDDAFTIVHYPDNHYVLQVIKGNNGAVLWSKAIPPGARIFFNIVPDLDLDGNEDVLLTLSTSNYPVTYTVYAVKGNTGAVLWQDVTTNAQSVYAGVYGDLNGDGIQDVIIQKNIMDPVTYRSTFQAVAKKGNNGAQLWIDTTTASLSGYVYGSIFNANDLNGDLISDIIIELRGSDYLTGKMFYNIKAKIGKNGISLWTENTEINGGIYGLAWPIGDLNKDTLMDIYIQKTFNNVTTGISTYEAKAKIGKNGTQLWKDTSSVKNGQVFNTMYFPVWCIYKNGDTTFFFDIVKNNSAGNNRTLKYINGNNGVAIWNQNVYTPKGWKEGRSYAIGDINNDKSLDIFYVDYKKNMSSATDYLLYTKTLNLKNGTKIWDEIIHGKLNQQKVLPLYAILDLNGDKYNDLLLEYDNSGNKTIKVKKSPTKLDLWKKSYLKTISNEQINVDLTGIQDINGDSLFDIFLDITRNKVGSQSETLEALIGKNGSLKWSDSISGTTASFSQEYLGDVNGDGVSDIILNGEKTNATTHTSLYKVKNMNNGANFWTESLSSGIAATYGEMYACNAGDLKGNNKLNILKYAHTATNTYSINAKTAPAGASLWKVTSNKDIENACTNTGINFNGDTKDDILFQTFKDVYAITTK
jgi:hypothetical protein